MINSFLEYVTLNLWGLLRLHVSTLFVNLKLYCGMPVHPTSLYKIHNKCGADLMHSVNIYWLEDVGLMNSFQLHNAASTSIDHSLKGNSSRNV